MVKMDIYILVIGVVFIVEGLVILVVNLKAINAILMKAKNDAKEISVVGALTTIDGVSVTTVREVL